MQEKCDAMQSRTLSIDVIFFVIIQIFFDAIRSPLVCDYFYDYPFFIHFDPLSLLIVI